MECPCKPDFVFKTKTTYNTHLKSDMHCMYQLRNELDQTRTRIIQLETDLTQKNFVERTLISTINSYELWAKSLVKS